MGTRARRTSGSGPARRGNLKNHRPSCGRESYRPAGRTRPRCWSRLETALSPAALHRSADQIGAQKRSNRALQNAKLHRNASITEHLKTVAAVSRIWIDDADENRTDAAIDERLRTGRGSSNERARLERHKRSQALGAAAVPE